MADDMFAGLLEAAPDAMVRVDGEGRIALFNAQAERLFGYRRDELIGQPVELLVPCETRDRHPAHQARYMADPQLRPDGRGDRACPKDIIDRVSEPFFTAKPNGDGTGLGLATVYGILTQARGHLRIYSEPGMGTTLTALRTVTGETAPSELPAPAQAPRGRGESILAVEGEAATREVTRRILERSGYKVMTRASGREALGAITAGPGRIDALLTDVVMPQMQGTELAGNAVALLPGLPVLFMPGHTQGLLNTQGVLEPGLHLIEKPFSECSLLTKLRQVRDIRAEDDDGGVRR